MKVYADRTSKSSYLLFYHSQKPYSTFSEFLKSKIITFDIFGVSESEGNYVILFFLKKEYLQLKSLEHESISQYRF